MGSSDSDADEEYGEATLDDGGRLTIPYQLREELDLVEGMEFRVVRKGNDVRLERKQSELVPSESGRSEAEWVGEAFHDAGEVTFGSR